MRHSKLSEGDTEQRVRHSKLSEGDIEQRERHSKLSEGDIEQRERHSKLSEGDTEQRERPGALSGQEIALYLPAGVATAPLFMARLGEVLAQRLIACGANAQAELLLPYGAWDRSLAAQLYAVGRDIRLRPASYATSRGGAFVLDALPSAASPKPPAIAFVAHSAGGIAAVHAAYQIAKRGDCLPPPVVMIGSPRFRIPETMRDRVLHIHAIKPANKGRQRHTDAVTRIGTFGGFQRGKRRLPTWHSDRHGPCETIGIPIIGGHADYFREQAPYVNTAGQSNMEITLAAFWQWLQDKIC